MGDPTLFDSGAEGPQAAAKSGEAVADRSPAAQPTGGDARGGPYEPDDLILYWNGDSIGVLGAWIWERSPAPMGEAGAGLRADRELHEWIAEKLQAGPDKTSRRTQVALRWTLWRLFVTFGPGEVPESAVPVPPMRRT